MELTIEEITKPDFPKWKQMRRKLYSKRDDAFHEEEMRWFSGGQDKLCLVLRDSKNDAEMVGFIELSLRNLVDGCLTSPVGYIEGMYIEAPCRGQGGSHALMERAKEWFKSKGCSEMATDAELHDTPAQEFHRHNGFQETFRIVEYRKDL